MFDLIGIVDFEFEFILPALLDNDFDEDACCLPLRFLDLSFPSYRDDSDDDDDASDPDFAAGFTFPLLLFFDPPFLLFRDDTDDDDSVLATSCIDLSWYISFLSKPLEPFPRFADDI